MPLDRQSPGKGKSIDKNTSKNAFRLLRYITDSYRIPFILVLVSILISSAAQVSSSLFLQVLIDSYIVPLIGSDNPVFAGLLRALTLMASIYLVGIICTLGFNRMMAVISQGVQKQIRDELFAYMQRLPIKYFDTHTYGDVMSRYTNDIDTLRQMLSQSIPQLFVAVVSITFILIGMLITSIPLTLFVVFMTFLILTTMRFIGGKSAGFFMKQQAVIGKLNGYIEEMINGQKVVKVFCYEDDTKQQFDILNDDLRGIASNANQYANILMPVMVQMGNLQYVLLAVIGGLMAIGGVGGMTLGGIAAFLQLSRSFSQPLAQVSTQINSVIMALAGAGRIFGLMDEPVETDQGYVTLVNAKYNAAGTALQEADERTSLWAWKHPHEDGTLTYTKLEGDVRFYDVDFSYQADKPILHNVSLFAKPGQKIAFVGATGAGKTTITNLINRFYDLDDGKIRYDGININKIRKSDLRRSLGVVLQDTNLFTGTIMENIRYGSLNATDEEVIVAANLAGADSFISRLPDGYKTEISGDGSGLSQGQRQLLSIARAAVADPPVMILDEATSSIDTRTESIVQRGMDALMYGRTVFVIAHRLSTIRNADAIILLDQGRIVERGDHKELITQKGRYYQLYTGAFELD